MSNEVSIFEQGGLPANAVAPGTKTALGQALAGSRSSVKRITINTNGTFKRVVGGKQIGAPVRSFQAIILAALPRVSREYYAAAYDSDAKATLPDCWSNLGVYPESSAKNMQSNKCDGCPQNIAGSGDKGKGRACRYQRRIAIMLAGADDTDPYQLKIPAKSLFGDGKGHKHPFESYCQYLAANGFSPDTVITKIAYNEDAETMELEFSPVRAITNDEFALVQEIQAKPITDVLTKITAAEADGVTEAPKPVAKIATEPEEVDTWGSVEAATPVEATFEEVAPAEPTKRKTKEKPVVVENKALEDALSEWGEVDA
jgi:hypothetical protein